MSGPVLPRHRDEVFGRVEVLEGLPGEGIETLPVVVWLPPGYDDDPGRRYPVLYQHDGHNAVDPATSYSGQDWQIDDVAAAMIRSGRIRPFLLVGRHAGDERFDEYGHTAAGAAYLRWLTGTLKPLIDARYRTLPGRDDTFTMGSSMGGLIAFLATWWHPEAFGGAACLSPYFPDDLVADVEESETWPPAPLRVYLDNGGDELDDSFQPNVDHLRGFLDRLGVETSFFRDEGAPHHESAWSARVWRPLEFLFGV